MSFDWRIATENDFYAINALLVAANQNWGTDGIRHRVIIPLFLEQLIIFENDGQPCGFVTYAMMDGQSACHQSTLGVLPADWRSGEQLWVVDLVAVGGDGDKMFSKLKEDVREAIKSPVRYFRLKRQQTKRVELTQGEA